MKERLGASLVAVLCFAITLAGQETRPRVAVVLSGGGAKGAAHIGVLRAVEEAGIEVDYVVGTSMGAVVGGLYAAGVSPSELDSLVCEQDWELLLSDKTERRALTLDEREMEETYVVSVPLSGSGKGEMSGLVRGQNLANLLSRLTIGLHDSIDFGCLQHRFACVATNIVNGDEVVFLSGRLGECIRASMAIPGMFTPVNKDDMVLVDGGLVNNFPVDVARGLGADIVIGSTVQGDLNEAQKLSKLTDILMQIVSIACRQKYDANVEDCDVCIKVETGDYTMLDFKPAALDTLIARGYRAAKEKLSEFSLNSECRKQDADRGVRASSLLGQHSLLSVGQIVFEGATEREREVVLRRARLGDSCMVDIDRVEAAVTMLRKDFNYPDAYYSLTGDGQWLTLTFHVAQRSRSSVRFGLRFDSKDMLSAAMRGDVYLSSKGSYLNSRLTLEARLGKQCRAAASYSFSPMLNRELSLGYAFFYSDFDVYRHGSRLYNLIFRKHRVRLDLVNLDVRNMRYRFGADVEVFNYNLLNSATVSVPSSLRNDAYVGYYAAIDYSSDDDGAYPSRGLRLSASYRLLTDNGLQMGSGSAVSIVGTKGRVVVPLGGRWAVLPSWNGRLLFGSRVPMIYGNALGGNYDGKYVEGETAFVGINSLESAGKCLVVARVDLRWRVAGNHYLSIVTNAALSSGKVSTLGNGEWRYGFGGKYGWKSRFGPMEAMMGYCNHSRNAALLVNLGYYF